MDIREFLEAINTNTVMLIIFVIAYMYGSNKAIKKILTILSEKYLDKRIFLKNLIPLLTITNNIISIFVIFFFVIGFKMEKFIALGISAGVAIGFAVQDFLSNSFAGFVILFTRPFNVGDKVEVSGYYGEVIDITLLKIRIVTLDDSVVSIPSKSFLSSTVSNSNAGELNCQVMTKIHVPGNSDFQELKKIALEAVYSSPYTYLKKPVAILFKDDFIGMPLTVLTIKSYVFDHRYEGRYSSDIYERIMAYVVEHSLISQDFYRSPFISYKS